MLSAMAILLATEAHKSQISKRYTSAVVGYKVIGEVGTSSLADVQSVSTAI